MSIDERSAALRESVGTDATLRLALDAVANQLCLAVDGDFDFAVRAPIEDETVEKLTMLINFVLDTARRGMTALREHNAALAEIDRAKTAFFSNVSHEFRTPLTLMLGPLEEALAGGHGALPGSLRDQLEVTQRNALRLLKMVNGLLEFSRIEAGRLRASFAPIDLAALTTELASVFRSAIERAGLSFVVECAPLPQPIWIDRHMWERVVLNLLSNALKFTFDGEIRVTLRWARTGAELEVKDTGIGIAPEELPRVFERFHRVSGARSRSHEGTGIGLSHAQELVRLHGGAIAVESEPGRGSAFRVTLRSGSAHLAPDQLCATAQVEPVSTDRPAFVEEALHWLPDESVPVPARPTVPADARVLVADDNADMRAYLRRVLGERWRVDTVPDGVAALEAALRDPPDLVLTDVMMPRLDGFGLLGALRSDERTRQIPVVLLSARAGEEATVGGLDAGADDYVVKPFSARELVARVASQLALAASRREVELQRADVVAREQQARREAELQREHLRSLIMHAPMAMWLLRGNHVVDLANAEAGRLVPNTLGRALLDALPPEASRGLAGMLDAAARAAAPAVAREVPLRRGERGEPSYFNFVSAALRELDGRGDAVLVLAFDVTDEVVARRENEVLYRLATSLGRELDTHKLLQIVTDEATAVTGAQFGSFFFNARRPAGGAYMLYTLSGAPREAFAGFPLPRATPLFAPTFRGEGIVRFDDVRRDPRFSAVGPQPPGHLPVVSYLAAPVVGKSGEVFGALFFGHGEPGRFTAAHERIVAAIAAQAAVALGNARLYDELRESEDRVRLALESSAQGTWDHDLAENTLRLSARGEQLLGVQAGASLRYVAFLERIDAEDRERVRSLIDAAMRPHGDGRFEAEFRAAGGERWLAARGQVLFEHGRPVRFMGTLRDATVDKLAEEQREKLVAELRASEERARAAYERAREADRRKDEFLALLGHELRNPLAPILTAVQLMSLRGDQGARRERELIERQVRHLVRLVDDLLDVSRITRGKIQLNRERLELSAVIARAVEMASPLLEQRSHALTLDVPRGLWVAVDSVRLAQVIANLLTNAAKYTDPAGHIVVRAWREDGRVAVSVRDDGQGIPRDLLPHVFDLFVQGERSPDRSQGGLGIGLTLVRTLTELHGGDVEARSEGRGQGSEFVVRLPALDASATEEPAIEKLAVPRVAASGQRILVVDDNRDAAEILAEALRAAGHQVEVAHDGAEALAIAPGFSATTALVDIGLPVMDGYETVARLREVWRDRPVRFVAVTGYGQEADRASSRAAGFEAHVVKPVDLGVVLELVAARPL